MDPETLKHGADWGISEGNRGRVGGWKEVNQQTRMHKGLIQGHRQQDGEGLGHLGQLKGVNVGHRGT